MVLTVRRIDSRCTFLTLPNLTSHELTIIVKVMLGVFSLALFDLGNRDRQCILFNFNCTVIAGH